MEYIHLVGGEEVQRAASEFQAGARTIANVSSNIQLVFEAHQRFLDNWLNRCEELMPRACPLCHDDGLYCPKCKHVGLLEAQLKEAQVRAQRLPTDTKTVWRSCGGSGWDAEVIE